VGMVTLSKNECRHRGRRYGIAARSESDALPRTREFEDDQPSPRLRLGKKAEFFPAISAFSAFDRLWGIFFYFVRTGVLESWSGGARNGKPPHLGLSPSVGEGGNAQRVAPCRIRLRLRFRRRPAAWTMARQAGAASRREESAWCFRTGCFHTGIERTRWNRPLGLAWARLRPLGLAWRGPLGDLFL
jgi:hypothetical protein